MTWYDDDSLWLATRSMMFADRLWEKAPQDVDDLLQLLDLQTPASVLDLCCGPGRHSLELARRGFAVTGVDRTASYLDEGRQHAEKEGLEVEWVQSDMRAFRRPDAFDAALNLFTSFGYFENRVDDRRVVENLFQCLKPGGKVALELMGKENLARVFQPRDWREVDGDLWLYERELQQDWSWISNRWIHVQGDQCREFRVGHRLYSAFELTSLLEDCGFRSARAYGSLAGIPYDQDAQRLVVVAEK
jgi:SAM-dependent methyltransferase